jgi:uncharacterized protein YbjT (DUF2867 family)
MILVTGATGAVGQEVARSLASTRRVRVLTRDPARLTVSGPDIEVATGAYEDHDALLRALVGIRTVFLVTSSPTRPDDARFMAAAVEAGVRHVVKVSAYAAGEADADDLIADWHRANEETIRRSGLDWTFLRPRSFMSNALAWASSIRGEGVVRSPITSAAITCVDPRDIAEVAVRALTEPGHTGRIYALTGPEAITAAEQTDQLAEVLQRPLELRELTWDEAVEQWRKRYPPVVAEALLRSARRQARGGKTTVDPTFELVTGRRPGTFRGWAAYRREAFI